MKIILMEVDNDDIKIQEFITKVFYIWGKGIFLKRPNKVFSAFSKIIKRQNIQEINGMYIILPLYSSFLVALKYRTNNYEIIIDAITIMCERCTEIEIRNFCTAKFQNHKIMDNRTFRSIYSRLLREYSS